MADESMGGPAGPFFPSSIETNTRGRIPSRFFLESESCGRAGCHPDITAQWRGSVHHFASFNNQFYRKSIEYMQSVVGVQPSKWCAGCHDVALLLDGKFDRPIQEIVHTEEAQAGLACTACHAIVKVGSTMGQGDYEIEYPPLHDLAASKNPLLSGMHDLLIRIDPAPHRETFLKPFHVDQQGEFCSACHKVHLDVPVNAYRWQRGFNDYDAWQGSGVSGLGARAFYYPEKSQDCVDCHMPLTASDDKGGDKGHVKSHAFAAANTAVPTANRDADQIARVEAFLKDKVTVDVFALVREKEGAQPAAVSVRRAAEEPRISSTFPIGEESVAMPGAEAAVMMPETDVRAPLDGLAVRRGESARVDVVVRTRGVGHMFPGGTVDAFDVWVELEAKDESGRTIFWSGKVADDGKGPVEEGAHFYRSFMLDEHGNHIDKRNAWAGRAVLYARLVPPGAADVARFRLEIPPDCGDEITLTAKLNYRKFAHFYTGFAFAGVPEPGPHGDSVAPGHDDRVFVPKGDTSDVSGQVKEIPDVPIVVVSRATAKLRVLESGAPLEAPPAPVAEQRGRWNDYGIGLLLQGDLRAAMGAFEAVTAVDPAYADGWVNIGRTKLREGDTEAVLAATERALSLAPGLPRALFFRAMALKSQGRLEEARADLEKVTAVFPSDRVVLNELARIAFLRREYAEAVRRGKEVLAVDPEDVRAHYTLMLASRGAGDEAAAAAHETLYRRFKIDEDAQLLTGDYRRVHPADNAERQPIHEHFSVPVDPPAASAAGEPAAAEASGQ
jgi:tetratricopeptide (TPR) repeat protein